MLADMVIHLVCLKDCVTREVEQEQLQAGFLPGSGDFRDEYDHIKEAISTSTVFSAP